MGTDLKITVRDNIRRLLRLKEGESGVGRLMEHGFVNGTAQRILAGETSLGVDLLAKLAGAFRVQPWQLLVPGIDPDALPELHAPAARWPFPSIDRDQVLSLSGAEAAAVEVGLQVALAAAKLPQRKRNGTSG